MNFFATGSIIDPSRMTALQDDEDATLAQLRNEGTVREAFRFTEKHGVIGVFERDSSQQVKAQIDSLPSVAHGVMTFEDYEIIEL